MAVNKRKVHHYLKLLRHIKTWVLVVLILIFSALSVLALRQNNLRMVELRDELLAVDEAEGDIDTALRNLGNHITMHMNTNLNRPVELVFSFNRAVEEARKEAESQTSSNIYRRAQNECEVASIPLRARAQCIQDFVTSNAAPGENPAPLELPSKDFYIYDWASPKWSPDLAGFSILITVLLSLALTARLIGAQVLKSILKKRN